MGSISQMKSKAQSTLTSWSNSDTVGKEIAKKSAQGTVIGGATGYAGATILSTVQKKNEALPKIGSVGGAVVGANIGAISGTISGSVKYAAGNTAKFFGLTK